MPTQRPALPFIVSDLLLVSALTDTPAPNLPFVLQLVSLQRLHFAAWRTTRMMISRASAPSGVGSSA